MKTALRNRRRPVRNSVHPGDREAAFSVPSAPGVTVSTGKEASNTETTANHHG
ncbi:hypothetical protein BerOc1_02558 [Pseudodesulfovibrio hydrargyri]|uniref:Uncharacterized protein n=1 Tax=Pseudodesulfovibrio hydrargyri TaxID=2125990 RepID=A0A1J5NFY5_9BACT|nr:hypothetical protein BerOc1_02558 [Pseudodesulfovibrio hydrargyri]